MGRNPSRRRGLGFSAKKGIFVYGITAKREMDIVPPVRIAAARRLAILFTIVAFGIGAMTLAGWVFDIDLLKRVHPALVTMKANTAICLMLAAGSLLLQLDEPVPTVRRRVAQGFALIIGIAGLLTLLEHIGFQDFGIDQLLFGESSASAGQSFPGRMGVATCLSFMALSIALMVLDGRICGKYCATTFALASGVAVLLVFIHYFYGVNFEPIEMYATIALHAAMALLMLSLAVVLSRPSRGIMRALLDDGPGSAVARRMLPAALFLPVVLGWLRLIGQGQGWYGTGFGTALFAVMVMVVFSALVTWTASQLNRGDEERRRQEAAVRESEAVLRAVTNEAQVGLVMIDREHRYLFANQSYAQMLGLKDGNVVGRRLADVLPEIYETQIKPRLERGLQGERLRYELRVPKHPRTGEEHFYEISYEPRVGGEREPYVVVLIVDVTERKRAEQKLEQTVAERTVALRETIAELETFSYSIAHDIRGPLRSMSGFAELLEEELGPKLGETHKMFLRRIRESAIRMDQLLQDVLRYSRFSRGELPLERVNPHRLLLEVIDEYPDIAEKREFIDLRETCVQEEAWANPAGLTQVFSNLLTNALKFVPKTRNPEVRVVCEARDGVIEVTVSDNGIGIPPDQQERIFDAFQRLHGAEYAGTGIGLAIVKRVVERMGGSVRVESEREKGSIFHVELRRVKREKGT